MRLYVGMQSQWEVAFCKKQPNFLFLEDTMISTELLQIGDKVIIRVDERVRKQTAIYDDVPDGTVGVVCGFRDVIKYVSRMRTFGRESGVYHEKGDVSIWIPDGRIVPGGYVDINMLDDVERQRRDALYRDEKGVYHSDRAQIRIGDLPETKFWEGDCVYVRFPESLLFFDDQEMIVTYIDYQYIHKKQNDGSPYPFYTVSCKNSWTVTVEESWLEIVKRGDAWRNHHDE